jgi:amino acid transporter
MVGIGLVVGSGVFYKGGIVQATSTGSAVFLGYILDFVPIFLTAVIFAEFTVEYPVAGGAFTWTMSTLGEFPALMTLGLLSVNYVLTIAAVARVLTASIALLFNTRLTNFVIDIGGTELDFVSFAITLFLTLVLCVGTRESGTCMRYFRPH